MPPSWSWLPPRMPATISRPRVLAALAAVAAGGPIRAVLVFAWIGFGLAAIWRTFDFSFGPEAQYYKYVDEVTEDLERWRPRHLQVHGSVVPGSIERAVDFPFYRFKVQSCEGRPHAVMDVVYT